MQSRGKIVRAKKQGPLKQKTLPSKEEKDIIAASAEFYQGEYPSGRMFYDWEQAKPGLGDEILGLIKTEGEYRRSLQKSIINKDFFERIMGQIFAFIISLAFLFVSASLIREGHPVSGTILGGSSLVSLVTAFIMGRKESSRKNNSDFQDERSVE